MSNTNNAKYYKPSGKFSIPSFISVLFFSMAWAAILGGLYGYFSFDSPHPMFTWFAAIVIGILIGVAVGFGAKYTSIRAPFHVALLALLIAPVAIYSNCAVWLSYNASEYPANIQLIVNPVKLIQFWKIAVSEGYIVLQEWKPTGWILIGAWITEALALAISIILTSYKIIRHDPYCEACGKWAVNAYSRVAFGGTKDPRLLKTQLETGKIDALISFGPPSKCNITTVKLDVCPECMEIGFMTVITTSNTSHPKLGIISYETTPVVSNLIIKSDALIAAHALPIVSTDFILKEREKKREKSTKKNQDKKTPQ